MGRLSLTLPLPPSPSPSPSPSLSLSLSPSPSPSLPSSVFNLVLDSLHAIEIGGEVCATLGHGITDNAVAAHEYFGTDKVLTFLALLLQKYLLY